MEDLKTALGQVILQKNNKKTVVQYEINKIEEHGKLLAEIDGKNIINIDLNEVMDTYSLQTLFNAIITQLKEEID